jgi:predicted Zn-dependent protease
MQNTLVKQQARLERDSRRIGRLVWALSVLAAVLGGIGGLLGLAMLPSTLARHQLQEAIRHLHHRDYPRALAALEKAQRWQPHNGLAQFYLARLYRRQGNEAKFSQCIEEAQRRGLTWDRAQREWQLWSAQQGELALVEPYVGKLLAQPSEEIPDVCEAFTRGFLLTLRLNDARRMLESWEQSAPDDPMLHVMAGHVHAARQSWQEAAKAYQRARQNLPQDAEVAVCLGECLVELGRAAEALSVLEPFHDHLPTRTRVLRTMLRCQLMLDEDQAADALLHTWSDQEPLRGDDLRLAAQVALRRDQPERALEWLTPLLEKWPGDVEAHRLRIEILRRLGRDSEMATSEAVIASAASLLDQLQAKQQLAFGQPRNASLRSDIGQLLVDRQSREQGIKWLEAAVLVDPYQRTAREKLIETYTKLGLKDRAAFHQQRLEASHRNAL